MGNKKIMIVEDEWVIAKDIQQCLQKLGYTVTAIVSSGKKAIEMAKENVPDLILMDIVLKGEMDGIEVANIIHINSKIPIIYLTAFSDKKILDRAKISEPFGYMIKPFEEKELHTTIEIALYKDKMERERERLFEELKAAYIMVKTLSGLIPICSGCKKIRNDKGFWIAVETYISEHSEADFTHSICPDCHTELYPELKDL